ncbi:hypothetical protein KPP03845_106616 [Streptomyces xanthophaeus]|nr:hypothetical protein KPP03845_106616 [Streptomyces xanthophaeus]
MTEGVPVDLGRGTRRARAAALLTLALPGCAYVYQGEELGLADVEDIPAGLLQRTRGGPGPDAPTGTATDAAYPSWPADRSPRTERCRERPPCGSAPPEVRAPQEPAPGVGARGPAPPPSKETR